MEKMKLYLFFAIDLIAGWILKKLELQTDYYNYHFYTFNYLFNYQYPVYKPVIVDFKAHSYSQFTVIAIVFAIFLPINAPPIL